MLVLAGCTHPAAQPADRTEARASVAGIRFTAERQPDGFLLALENGSADRVGYNLCVSTLERRSGERWEQVVPPPICTMDLRTLAPGERATFPRKIDESLPPGDYRFVTKVEWPVGGSMKTLMSNTMTIR